MNTLIENTRLEFFRNFAFLLILGALGCEISSYDFRRVQMRSSPQCSRDAYLWQRRVLKLFTIIHKHSRN